MTLEKYIKAALPIIKLCKKEGLVGSGHKKLYRGTRELYSRIFYGFIDFIDQDDRPYFVSSKAEREYRAGKFYKINPGKDLSRMKWVDQPKFDPGRKKFILEHIYTGSMFTNAVIKLPENKLTVQGLSKLVRDNYHTAWILREENARLPKSKRGKTFGDAIKIYEKNDINIKRK